MPAGNWFSQTPIMTVIFFDTRGGKCHIYANDLYVCFISESHYPQTHGNVPMSACNVLVMLAMTGIVHDLRDCRKCYRVYVRDVVVQGLREQLHPPHFCREGTHPPLFY